MLADAAPCRTQGGFAVLIEMLPGDLAARITAELRVPTIGLGAGNATDAQVLVWQDAAGLNHGRAAWFVKKYADLHDQLLQVVRSCAQEVRIGVCPGPEHTFR